MPRESKTRTLEDMLPASGRLVGTGLGSEAGGRGSTALSPRFAFSFRKDEPFGAPTKHETSTHRSHLTM